MRQTSLEAIRLGARVLNDGAFRARVGELAAQDVDSFFVAQAEDYDRPTGEVLRYQADVADLATLIAEWDLFDRESRADMLFNRVPDAVRAVGDEAEDEEADARLAEVVPQFE